MATGSAVLELGPDPSATDLRGRVTFPQFLYRVVTCQLVTYFLAGMGAFYFLDYKALFESEPLAGFMRPMSSPWIAAGPALQVIRGLVFAMALWPFRRVFLEDRAGWLKLWGLLVCLCILSPTGPSPGSLEGFVYTTLFARQHVQGLPEVLLQTLAFAILVVVWNRKPHRAWPIAMGALSVLVVLMSLAGVFLPRPAAFG